MDSIVGSDLIVAALVFGCAGLTFAIAPFVIVMIGGIRKAETTNSGEGGYINTLFMAFCVHVVSCFFFMTVIYILDVFYDQSSYISGKIFQIFWAGNETQVMKLVGGNATSAAKGAWTTLYFVTTIINYVFALLPLLLIAGAASYGFKQARKDTYNENILTIVSFMSVSVIVATLFYIAWAKIASLALFLPDGRDLIDITQSMWKDILLKGV